MEKRDTGDGGETLIGTNGMVAGSDVWRRARRIVIKIGSALLVDRATGRVRATWLNSLADDIAALRSAGKEVVLVSSGAIALGRRVLGLTQHKIRHASSSQKFTSASAVITKAMPGVWVSFSAPSSSLAP